jgi:hypothetical protein
MVPPHEIKEPNQTRALKGRQLLPFQGVGSGGFFPQGVAPFY